MERFFNMDNKFFTAMSRLADLIILNVICMVCCLPVFTIGPAVTALFYMTLKMVRNEETYIVRGFFTSFRQNFRQGVVINLILLAIAAILYLDFRFVSATDTMSSKIMFVLLMAAGIFYVMVFTYVYPLLAKFDNTIRNTFSNSLLMAIRHLPYTLLMILVTLLPFLAFFYSPSEQVQGFALLFLAVMGPSTIAYVNSHFFVKIFDNYIPKEEGEETENAG